MNRQQQHEIECLKSDIATALQTQSPIREIDLIVGLDLAYAMHHDIMKMGCAERIAGVKLGVTAKAEQAYLGVEHPLIGSLLVDGVHDSNVCLPWQSSMKLRLGVAFRLSRDGRPSMVAPAVETMRVSFERSYDLTAPNLVLANLCTDKYMVGRFVDSQAMSKRTHAMLKRDGKVLNALFPSERLSCVEAVTSWMLQESRLRGFQQSEDALWLVALHGTTVYAEPGHYCAMFGSLGHLEFDVGCQHHEESNHN